MEFVIGGLAATSAGFLTNPIEVVKHQMELNKKSQYTDHRQFKNFLSAGINVAKRDGLKSLQKGLSPALGAHLVSYGMKLGTYQFGQNRGLTTHNDGQVAIPKSVLTSGVGGIVGQYMSSPFYFVKIQNELNNTANAHANANIANNNNANQQNNEKKSEGYMQTLRKIYKEHGIRGFFRGATASMPRAFIGTSQLTSFAVAKESLNKYDSFKSNPLLTTLCASTVAGVVLSMAMTPFDMVLTKMYKQAISPIAKEKPYEGFLDCMKKTYLSNGLKPFYRGMGPIYLKLGPHTVLCLVFWEEFKGMYETRSKSTDNFYQNNFGFMSNNNNDKLDTNYHEDLSIEYEEGHHDKNIFYWN